MESTKTKNTNAETISFTVILGIILTFAATFILLNPEFITDKIFNLVAGNDTASSEMIADSNVEEIETQNNGMVSDENVTPQNSTAEETTYYFKSEEAPAYVNSYEKQQMHFVTNTPKNITFTIPEDEDIINPHTVIDIVIKKNGENNIYALDFSKQNAFNIELTDSEEVIGVGVRFRGYEEENGVKVTIPTQRNVKATIS